MKKQLKWIVFTLAFLVMGFSMPSCPGQQAMQQQVDGLQAKAAENTKRIQTLESQLKMTNNELAQAKTLLAQVSNTVLAQKQALEQMETTLKTAVSKPTKATKATKAPARPTAKKKGR